MNGEQNYLVYIDDPVYGPSTTYVTPFVWPEDGTPPKSVMQVVSMEEEYIETPAEDLRKLFRYQELPVGLHLGMTEEEVLASAAEHGLELIYNPPEKYTGESDAKTSSMYALDSPLIPGFLLHTQLDFFLLDAPGYDDGQLRLYKFSLDLKLNMMASAEARQAKKNEVIDFVLATYGESQQNDRCFWHFNDTDIHMGSDHNTVGFWYQNFVLMN